MAGKEDIGLNKVSVMEAYTLCLKQYSHFFLLAVVFLDRAMIVKVKVEDSTREH